MVDVTLPLTYFNGSLGLYLLVKNPFIPLLLEIVITIAATKEISSETLLTRLAAGIWTLLFFRFNTDEVEKDNHVNTTSLSLFIQAFLYFNIRMFSIVLLHALKDYLYPFPAYTASCVIMSYPFLFDTGRRKRWEWFMMLTMGYNFAFGLYKAFVGEDALTLEIQLLMLLTPPMCGLLYLDFMKKKNSPPPPAGALGVGSQ